MTGSAKRAAPRSVFRLFPAVLPSILAPALVLSQEGGAGVEAPLRPSVEESASLEVHAPSREEGFVADVLERLAPWVVALEVEREKDLPSSRFQPRRLPREIEDYFKRPEGAVSGLLLDAEGHVLTSYYNVAGELKSIRVVLPDGDTLPARLVARAEADDLALVRVDGPSEMVLPEGSDAPPWAAEPPRAGEFVLALGRSPDPGRLTATLGIISATARNDDRAVQTDAKLNYGNVGGPLVNLDGRIVGISGFVGHVHPQWGLNSGIGFGTKSSTVRDVLPTLESGTNVEPPPIPFLGVRSDIEELGNRGAAIDMVVEKSAAEEAGLRKGDVIVEFGGEAVENFNRLRQLIVRRKVGEVVTVKVRRGEEVLDLEVTLRDRPRSP